MTLFTEKGIFTKETSNVDGTDQTVSLANASLTPKVLWLWTTGHTTANAYAEDYHVSYGFSDGTNDACIAGASEDNEASSDTAGVIRNDSVICILDAATTPTTINARADVVSFGAGQFVLNWAVSDAVASVIHYMVLGGTDITNVKVTQHSLATSTGNANYTGVGFQGDFVNLINASNTGTASQTVNTVATVWGITIGAATSSSNRWLMGGVSEHAQPTMDTYNWKEITRCIGAYDSTSGGDNHMADFVNFIVDGFTLNTVVSSLAATPFFSLVIKGGLWDVGNGLVPSGGGDETCTITSGRDPEGVMMFSPGTGGTTSGTTAEAQNHICIGGGDNNLAMGCTSAHDTDAAANAIAVSVSRNNQIISVHNANATASSSTLKCQATLTDMDNDGNFVINWNNVIFSALFYCWFAVSKTFAAGGNAVERAITDTPAISVSDSRIVSRNKTRTRSETITVSG